LSFHVELRQFLHVARAFNLTREELDARILHPWVNGDSIALQDRSWSAQRSKLTIIEGPELAPGDLGLGRGWSNAVREGEDVTAAFVAEAERQVGPSPADELKLDIVRAARLSPLPLRGVVELVAIRNPQRRPSEVVAVTEQAVWELLHRGSLAMFRGDRRVDRDHWQQVLLSWPSWIDAGPSEVTVAAAQAGAAPPLPGT
jgi:hypothetical protein